MKPKLPDAFKALPYSANLKIDDICKIYGLTIHAVNAQIKRGKIPAHLKKTSEINKESPKSFGVFNKARVNFRYWRLGDIRAHIAKLESEAN